MVRQITLIIGAVAVVALLAIIGGFAFVVSQSRSARPSLASSPTALPATRVALPTRTPRPSVASATPASLASSVALTLPTRAPRPAAVDRVTPLWVSASGYAPNSRDAQGNTTTFVPDNAVDGRLDTAWRVAGDGVNQWLLIEFAGPVEVREVRILPGYAKIDPVDGTNRFWQNRRVRRVRLEFSTGEWIEALLDDQAMLQSIPVNNIVTNSIQIVILESLPPAVADGRDFTPISEVEVLGVVR
ncbi:MAG: NADase-type glycan-binding domain-containing protein [Chloroflexus sp.]